MLKMILLAIVAALAIFLVYAATLPDTFSIARSARINAPADKIFPLIDDLRAMNTWLPFTKDDPKTQLTYSGPARGVGAVNEFGGGSAGSGRVAIIESTPASKVVMQLDMTAPMATKNRVEFSLVPSDGATDVTWAMSGKQPYLAKVLHAAIGARMIGKAFERGLADLKGLAEK